MFHILPISTCLFSLLLSYTSSLYLSLFLPLIYIYTISSTLSLSLTLFLSKCNLNCSLKNVRYFAESVKFLKEFNSPSFHRFHVRFKIPFRKPGTLSNFKAFDIWKLCQSAYKQCFRMNFCLFNSLAIPFFLQNKYGRQTDCKICSCHFLLVWLSSALIRLIFMISLYCNVWNYAKFLFINFNLLFFIFIKIMIFSRFQWNVVFSVFYFFSQLRFYLLKFCIDFIESDLVIINVSNSFDTKLFYARHSSHFHLQMEISHMTDPRESDSQEANNKNKHSNLTWRGVIKLQILMNYLKK